MERSDGLEPVATAAPLRVLALGNELLADDAFGILAGRESQRRFGGRIELMCTSAGGLHLLEDILGAKRLVVIDTIATGHCAPGTVRVFHEAQLAAAPGASPHSSGLFDAVALARAAGLRVPEEITVVAVEAFDCTTIGGAMHTDVAAALEPVIAEIGKLVSR